MKTPLEAHPRSLGHDRNVSLQIQPPLAPEPAAHRDRRRRISLKQTLISRRISPEMEMELDEGVRDRTFRIGAIRILAFDVLSTIAARPSPSRIADSFISESQSNN